MGPKLESAPGRHSPCAPTATPPAPTTTGTVEPAVTVKADSAEAPPPDASPGVDDL